MHEQIHRQSSGSEIIRVANEVNNGDVSTISTTLSPDVDLCFIEAQVTADNLLFLNHVFVRNTGLSYQSSRFTQPSYNHFRQI